MNNIKGKVIVNDFGNGFVNANNITIYISKKNLNNAFNGELVEVEYYKDNELYNGSLNHTTNIISNLYRVLFVCDNKNNTNISIVSSFVKNLKFIVNFYLIQNFLI